MFQRSWQADFQAGETKKNKTITRFPNFRIVKSCRKENGTRVSSEKRELDFAPGLYSKAFSTVKLWHSQEQRQDKQRQESEKFQGNSVTDGSCKECHFSFRNCFMLMHKTQRIMKAKKK